MANRFPESGPIHSPGVESNNDMDIVSIPTSPFLATNRPSSTGQKTVKHGNLRIAPDGTMSFKKTEAEVLMSAIQLGISHHLAKLHPKPKRDLLFPDFHSVDKTEFPQEGSESTPGHKYNDFKFKSYSPIAFRHLRDHFNIAPQDFISSLCYFPLKAIGNPGASGSLFYISQDDLFIIKTISSREALFLQKLLPGYWINLHQNKRTLLPKFFGLYSYASKGTKKIRLIVMNNLLPSNIEFHLKFDLKGSLHGRNASSKELSKSHPTLKDNDYLNRFENGIAISPEKYDLLVETIQRDCTVLESFEIMDYSLLVAMHNISEIRRQMPVGSELTHQVSEHPTATNLRLSLSLDNAEFLDSRSLAIVPPSQLDFITRDYLKRLPEGYFLARLPSGDLTAVYLGIIDILQSYVTKKKLEHTFKSIIYDGDIVSVHKPNFYSKRFQNFMSGNVFLRDPNQVPVNGSNIGSRRKPRRISLSGRPLRSLTDSYTTPPSYPVEVAQLNSSLPESNISDFSVQSVPTSNEDDLIRYSQLDLDQKKNMESNYGKSDPLQSQFLSTSLEMNQNIKNVSSQNSRIICTNSDSQIQNECIQNESSHIESESTTLSFSQRVESNKELDHFTDQILTESFDDTTQYIQEIPVIVSLNI